LEICSSEVWRPRWPILKTATTNPSVRDLLIQVLRHAGITSAIVFHVVQIIFNFYP
jgi:hypothetical protein